MWCFGDFFLWRRVVESGLRNRRLDFVRNSVNRVHLDSASVDIARSQKKMKV